MNNLADELRWAADRVAGLGDSSAAFDALSEVEVLAGQRSLAEAHRLLAVFSAWMAGTVARRSRPELGREGLAARRGFASPEAMIQHVNGSSRGEAVKLVASGRLMAETDAAELAADKRAADRLLDLDLPGCVDLDSPQEDAVPVPWQAPIVHALADGSLSVDQADAVRRGLGDIDRAVSASILRQALIHLVPEVTGLNVELAFRRARRLRDHLDEAGIKAREKQARDDTKFKLFRRHDGMVVLSGLLAPEQGEYWLSAYDCLTSPRRGGVRFVDKEQAAWAERIKNDPRTVDQIAADSFTALLKTGSDADQTRMYGGRHPAVRIIVTQSDLKQAALPHDESDQGRIDQGRIDQGCIDQGGIEQEGTTLGAPPAATPTAAAPVSAGPVSAGPVRVGHGYLEGNPSPLSLETVQQILCNTGQLRLLLDEAGHPLKLGRSVRTFTPAQRVAMSIRDGGCMSPDCDMPPSTTEAHHADQWVRDNGVTDIDAGLLLCARCHRRLHQEGWRVIADHGKFWLQPPTAIDPEQTLIALPSKNPLMLELQQQQQQQQQHQQNQSSATDRQR